MFKNTNSRVERVGYWCVNCSKFICACTDSAKLNYALDALKYLNSFIVKDIEIITRIEFWESEIQLLTKEIN